MSLKNPVTPPGIDPGTVQLVAQRLNHYATPGPLTEMSTTLPLSRADCLEIWDPEPPGTLRACPGVYRDCFTVLHKE